MSRPVNIKRELDWITIALYFILVVCGWLSIYGATYDFNNPLSMFDFDNRAGKQFVWILTSFILIGIILLIDYKIYNSFLTNFAYIAVVFLLIITVFIAPDIKGSRSWLVFGPVSFQPAELAKVTTALAIARYIYLKGKISGWKDYFLLGLLIFVPFCIVVLQNETGSALVFAAFLLVFYREGMSGMVLLSGVFAVLLFIIIVRFGDIPLQNGEGDLGILIALSAILLVEFLYTIFLKKEKKKNALIMLGGVVGIALIAFILNIWLTIRYDYVALFMVAASFVYWGIIAFVKRSKKLGGLVIFIVAAVTFCFAVDYMFDEVLQPHQQIRIKILLNMEDDLSGAGYNVNQSKIAIGSGGFFGKGFLQGTQTKLNYVPEQATDFIFCTVGEEFGFVGTSFILVLFLFFLLRLLHIAERQRDTFSRVYGYGVLSIFFFHILVNIGMVVGLMPVIGIPLPFFSYGGSSLWAFTVLLFILLRLDASRGERMR
jgi:rod shape determining protein RodA